MKNNLIQLESIFDLDFQERAEVIIAISKPKNFFKTYFKNLPYARTNLECFNKLNELHFEVYGEYMYSSYESFKVVCNRHYFKTEV